MIYRKEDLGNGWFRCAETLHRQRGRYCNACGERITEGDVFYTRNPGASTVDNTIDLCEKHYPPQSCGLPEDK